MTSILRCAALLALVALSGCGWFGSSDKREPILANLPTGPDSRRLLRQLPDGLPGDRENARHSGNANAPLSLEPTSPEEPPRP
ncbi:MAG: hypothetical protein Tsb008_07180 [Rhodothalassiaceae bacterium]